MRCERASLFTRWAQLQKEFGEDIAFTKSVLMERELEGCSVGEIMEQGLTPERPKRFMLGGRNRTISDEQTLVSPSVQGRAMSEGQTCATLEETTRFGVEKLILLKRVKCDSSKVSSVDALAALKAELCAYDGCALKAMATNTVFADGNPTSPVMFIGEAPGQEEDRQGLPFVGKSGQLLNKMIESIGLTRQDVYVTNVVNWRPPGNRPPTQDEISQCLPFLERHIDLIAPKVIVLLGSTAMKGLLKFTGSLSQARGVLHGYTSPGGLIAKVLVTFHPSYLLRVPSQKRLAWEDLLRLQECLQALET
jgi:uracil-DNA glycosylase family 4